MQTKKCNNTNATGSGSWHWGYFIGGGLLAPSGGPQQAPSRPVGSSLSSYRPPFKLAKCATRHADMESPLGFGLPGRALQVDVPIGLISARMAPNAVAIGRWCSCSRIGAWATGVSGARKDRKFRSANLIPPAGHSETPGGLWRCGHGSAGLLLTGRYRGVACTASSWARKAHIYS
jgi:hypothetical protein